MPTPEVKRILNAQDCENARVYYGNPNGNVYGQKGWTCQDWTNGALYVCTADGTGNWTVLGSGGGNPSNPLVDASDVPSVNFWNRTLYDEADIEAFNWSSRVLYDGVGTTAANAGGRTLHNTDGNATVDWTSYLLIDIAGLPSLNWTGRGLVNELNEDVVLWEAGVLFDGWTWLSPSVNWQERWLCNSDGNTVLNWQANQIIDGSSYLSIDWGNRWLANPNGDAVLSWDIQVAYASDASVALNWNDRRLYAILGDGTSTLSVDWNGFSLIDSAELESLNWSSRALFGLWSYDAGGSIIAEGVYSSSSTSGTVTPSAGPNTSCYVYLTGALAATLTVNFTTQLASVPVGGIVSITSTNGVTALTVTTTGYTRLGTAVTTLAAGTTVQWRKMSASVLARL